jgi:hypothetical protein
MEMNRDPETPAAYRGSYLAQQGPLFGVALERHKARCHICRHAQRQEIEEDFLDWTSPREIAETYGLADFRAIYRHANALGLFDQRRTNIQRATDRIIEQVGEVEVNALAVVAAIRTALNEERQWLESIRRLMNHNLCDGEQPASPERLARPIPPAYWKRISPPAPQKIPAQAIERTDPETAAATTQNAAQPSPPVLEKAAAPPAPQRAASSQQPKPAPEKSPSAPAPKPAPVAEVKSAPDPYNAPGQVAGLPWPWPVKKIKFARRRPWYSIRDG